MANIKSAKKRTLVINKKTALNKSRKSAIKTAEKRFMAALEAGDKEVASQKLVTFERLIKKSVAKGIFHKNAASRKVSRLAKRLNAAAE